MALIQMSSIEDAVHALIVSIYYHCMRSLMRVLYSGACTHDTVT